MECIFLQYTPLFTHLIFQNIIQWLEKPNQEHKNIMASDDNYDLIVMDIMISFIMIVL